MKSSQCGAQHQSIYGSELVFSILEKHRKAIPEPPKKVQMRLLMDFITWGLQHFVWTTARVYAPCNVIQLILPHRSSPQLLMPMHSTAHALRPRTLTPEATCPYLVQHRST